MSSKQKFEVASYSSMFDTHHVDRGCAGPFGHRRSFCPIG